MAESNQGAQIASPAKHLELPASVKKTQILWPYALSLTTIHLLALLAFVPWFFSWTGVILAVLGLYVFGTLGINLCFHRLLTHRSFDCPLWLEHFLATLGVCCLQDRPGRWVAIHRVHHQHSDEQEDPHSPLVNFFWGHMGWLLVKNDWLATVTTYERYARDVLRDPYYLWFERKLLWAWMYAAHALLFFLTGFAIGWAWDGDVAAGVQFGSSLLVWGVFLRTVAVWHITWSVNSVTHVWGYQNYATGENSRNNVLIGLVSNGEGWHNNHHFDQRSAAHGHRWWELDVTYLTIRAMQLVGLARNVITPSSRGAKLPAAEGGASHEAA